MPISPQLFPFLDALRENNNKPWFDAHKAQYQELRTNFTAFITSVIKAVNQFEDLGSIDAAKSLYRINRDIRFSADKTPYKTNFSAEVKRDGKKAPGAPYYIHLQPCGSFIATGFWQPAPDVLGALRQEIDYNAARFNAILNEKTLKAYVNGLDNDDKLSRPPKGYAADNPNIELLKYKSYIIVRNFNSDEVVAPGFADEVVKTIKAMKPFKDFLNNAVAINTEQE